MAQRRHHYEHAFEEFLRSRRIPYVAVDEAKKALIPDGQAWNVVEGEAGGAVKRSLKSFDFVLYGEGSNLLVEVKGRRISPVRRNRPARATSPDEDLLGPLRSDRPMPPPRRSRLDSWVTLEDVESLSRWERLFGPEFEAAFVFVYWCDDQPPDALFDEIFDHAGRWYSLRAVTLREYAAAMKTRSPRWRTVHIPIAAFDRISRPLVGGFRSANG